MLSACGSPCQFGVFWLFVCKHGGGRPYCLGSLKIIHHQYFADHVFSNSEHIGPLIMVQNGSGENQLKLVQLGVWMLLFDPIVYPICVGIPRVIFKLWSDMRCSCPVFILWTPDHFSRFVLSIAASVLPSCSDRPLVIWLDRRHSWWFGSEGGIEFSIRVDWIKLFVSTHSLSLCFFLSHMDLCTPSASSLHSCMTWESALVADETIMCSEGRRLRTTGLWYRSRTAHRGEFLWFKWHHQTSLFDNSGMRFHEQEALAIKFDSYCSLHKRKSFEFCKILQRKEIIFLPCPYLPLWTLWRDRPEHSRRRYRSKSSLPLGTIALSSHGLGVTRLPYLCLGLCSRCRDPWTMGRGAHRAHQQQDSPQPRTNNRHGGHWFLWTSVWYRLWALLVP